MLEMRQLPQAGSVDPRTRWSSSLRHHAVRELRIISVVGVATKVSFAVNLAQADF
jgi:hypothetical protein